MARAAEKETLFTNIHGKMDDMNLIPSRARYSVARSVSRPGQTQRARPRSCAHAVSLACYTALYLFISGGSVMPQNGTRVLTAGRVKST